MKDTYRANNIMTYNLESDQWESFPGCGKEPDANITPQRKERPWWISAIPIWLLIILAFLLLIRPRELTVYSENGNKLLTVHYVLWQNKLRSIELFDARENKAGVLNRVNGWGSKSFILTRSTEKEDVYKEFIFLNGLLSSRSDIDGSHNRTIYYDTNGYIVKTEETDNKTIITPAYQNCSFTLNQARMEEAAMADKSQEESREHKARQNKDIFILISVKKEKSGDYCFR